MRRFSTHSVLLLVVAFYFASSWIQIPASDQEPDEVPSLRLGPLALAPPGVLSGDSPHYLVAVNSLVGEGDWDLNDNYRRAVQGGNDAGRRFRGRPLDAHAERDEKGRLIGVHSPFFPLLAAAAALPFRGTPWTEPAAIWLIMALALAALQRMSLRTDALGIAVLALASPFWCYSRDLWTEPVVTLCWILLALPPGRLGTQEGSRGASSDRPWIRFAAGFFGTLIKYPFAVVPLTMGLQAWRKGNRREAGLLVSSAVLGLVTAVGAIQWLFRDMDHFSLFHSGIHAGFDGPLDGVIGLLLSPENGLLWFFPVFFWAGRPLWRKQGLFWPVMAFFLVHASYSDWMGGTGFSARYLVPALPVLVVAMGRQWPRSLGFRAALIYSGFWAALGGLAPSLVYDRSPWGVLIHIWQKLT